MGSLAPKPAARGRPWAQPARDARFVVAPIPVADAGPRWLSVRQLPDGLRSARATTGKAIPHGWRSASGWRLSPYGERLAVMVHVTLEHASTCRCSSNDARVSGKPREPEFGVRVPFPHLGPSATGEALADAVRVRW